jgi:hypothetical protein
VIHQRIQQHRRQQGCHAEDESTRDSAQQLKLPTPLAKLL